MSELFKPVEVQTGSAPVAVAVAELWEVDLAEVPPLLLRPEDVARLLSISRGMVYTLMRLRELPSVKVGKCRRVTAVALRRYVDGLDPGDAA